MERGVNMFNPAGLMQMMNLWNRFKGNHPKFEPFLSAVQANGVKEGSVFEVNVTTPDGQKIASNLKLTADDMEILRQLMESLPKK